MGSDDLTKLQEVIAGIRRGCHTTRALLELFSSNDLSTGRHHGCEKGSGNNLLAEDGNTSHTLKRQAAQSRHYLRARAKLVRVKSWREQKRTHENKQKSH